MLFLNLECQKALKTEPGASRLAFSEGGPGRLVLEYLGKLLTQQACLRISWNALGCLAECSRPPKIATLGSLKIINLGSRSVPEGLKSVPRGVLDPSWSLFSSWRPLGAVLEASWSALGRLWDRKKVLLIGSWPLQEDFQERFRPS